MTIWLGTSGYSYDDWVGPFYPPGTRAGRMLAHYARHFPLVELNFTYYRLPTPVMLARLAEQTPAGFQFVVKMTRSLSHEQSARELEAFRRAVDELQRRESLAGVLCQFPQAVHDTAKHRAWVELLGREFTGYRLAVEFRHHSWARAEVSKWLGEQAVELVSVEVPDLPGLFPRGLVWSGPRVYVRFHSRSPENWYGSDKDRYDYHFEDATLEEWIAALRHVAQQADRVLLLFNNCQRGQAAANAQRMRELLARLEPSWTVIPPFAEPEAASQQRLLFE